MLLKLTLASLVAMSCFMGCQMSQPQEMVGIRIFNEHPRLQDDEVWVSLIDKETGDHIFRGLLHNGGHDPVEINNIHKSSSVYIEIQYVWFSEDGIHGKHEKYQQLVEFVSDLDARIAWTSLGDDREDEPEANLERKPTVTITEGHPPIF